MSNKTKGLSVIIFTIFMQIVITLSVSGCNNNATAETTPIVETIQDISAEVIEAPPTAPAV